MGKWGQSDPATRWGGPARRLCLESRGDAEKQLWGPRRTPAPTSAGEAPARKPLLPVRPTVQFQSQQFPKTPRPASEEPARIDPLPRWRNWHAPLSDASEVAGLGRRLHRHRRGRPRDLLHRRPGLSASGASCRSRTWPARSWPSSPRRSSPGDRPSRSTAATGSRPSSRSRCSPSSTEFTVDVPGPDDLIAEGNFWDYEYTFSRNGVAGRPGLQGVFQPDGSLRRGGEPRRGRRAHPGRRRGHRSVLPREEGLIS